jgi:predicted dehydrogenase
LTISDGLTEEQTAQVVVCLATAARVVHFRPGVQAVVDTAKQMRRHLTVYFGWNYSPVIERTIALLADGGIGAVEYFAVTMSSQTRELLTDTGAYPDASPESAPDPATWTDPALSGGGYGQAQLSHALALALALTGARVCGAFAAMAQPPHARVELYDAMTLRLDSGGIASVGGASAYTGADANKHHLALEAVGSEGQLFVDVFRDHFSCFDPTRVRPISTCGRGDGAYNASLAARRLVDLALGRTTVNPAPGELGAYTVEALELAYRSAASGRFETASRP